MKKHAVLVFSIMVLVSLGSAAMIPKDITIDLNIDIFDDNKKNDTQNKKKNRSYGERVNGQAVHTETKPNNPETQRNTQEYGITEQDTSEKDDFFQSIGNFFSSLFGGGGQDRESNSIT